ncbi:hypothetical protein ACFOD0_00485 [Shewanella intestini]|uniref:DUF3265 domain-containing protein n=1 Tax=Shewanella intestini TaxID=2017544 RepID=A0ABS5HZ32_9GAMM|nr:MULTISPECIES: hypothetical protein [Shewanella]MBR9727048.1 hypothetical protein [Shewanella intestini]MRG35849.1 hypothetical protein [Shewanella sp. XMDDZSB0408]
MPIPAMRNRPRTKHKRTKQYAGAANSMFKVCFITASFFIVMTIIFEYSVMALN